MKRWVVNIIASVALLVSGSFTPSYAADGTLPMVNSGETILLVEASGNAAVKPDLMHLEAGVTTTGRSAREAVDENNRKMAAVLQSLRAEGIRPSAVRTEDFKVNPQFADGDDENAIIGYRVRNTVVIELRDFTTAGKTISALFDAGANDVGSPRFDVDEGTFAAASAKAESNALQQARRQADSVAASLGLKVARVLRVSNLEIDFERGYGSSRGGLIVVTGSRIAQTPLEAGELTIPASIYVEFALVSA